MERRRVRKKVSFEIGGNEEGRNKERILKVKEEMLRECKEMRGNWEGRIKRTEERLKGIEEGLKEVKEMIKIREDSSNRSEFSEISEGGGQVESIVDGSQSGV